MAFWKFGKKKEEDVVLTSPGQSAPFEEEKDSLEELKKLKKQSKEFVKEKKKEEKPKKAEKKAEKPSEFEKEFEKTPSAKTVEKPKGTGGAKGLYYWFEDKYYGVLDHIPSVYKIIDPIDAHFPSFILCIIILLLLIGGIGFILMNGLPFANQANVTITLSKADSGETVPNQPIMVFVDDTAKDFITDSNGRVLFQALMDSNILVKVEGVQDYENFEAEFSVLEKDFLYEIRLSKKIIDPCILNPDSCFVPREIHFVNEDGLDITDVALFVRFSCSNSSAGSVKPTSTSVYNGKISVKLPPSCGSLLVSVIPDSKYKEISEQIVSGNEVMLELLGLEQMGTIFVSVSDSETNEPIDGITIKVFEESDSEITVTNGLTDYYGEWSEAIDPGNYFVTALDSSDEPQHYSATSIAKEIVVGSTVQFDLELTPVNLADLDANSIQVMVIDANTSQRVNAHIVLKTLDDQNIVGEVTDSNKARFLVSADIDYELEIIAKGYFPFEETVSKGDSIIAELTKVSPETAGTANVKVFNSQGLPALSSMVYLYYGEGAKKDRKAPYEPSLTNYLGEAKIEWILPGNYYTKARTQFEEGQSVAKAIDANKVTDFQINMSVKTGSIKLDVFDLDSGSKVNDFNVLFFDKLFKPITDFEFFELNSQYSFEAGKEIFAVVKANGYHTAASELTLIEKSVSKTLAVPLIKDTGSNSNYDEPSIEFIGLFDETNEAVEKIELGKTYYAKFALAIDSAPGTIVANAHIRTGNSSNVLADPLYLTDVIAPALPKKVFGSSFTKNYSNDSNKSVSEAKWINLEWGDAKPLEITSFVLKAKVTIRSQVNDLNALRVWFKAFTIGADQKTILLSPEDDSSFASLNAFTYANAFTELFDLCGDEEFCYMDSIVGADGIALKPLIENDDGFPVFSVLKDSKYNWNFSLFNNYTDLGETDLGLYSATSSGDSTDSIEFGNYSISTPDGAENGNPEASSIDTIALNSFDFGKKISGTAAFTPIDFGLFDDPTQLRFDLESFYYLNELRIHSSASLLVTIEPEIFPAFEEIDPVTVTVQDSFGKPIKNAPVKVVIDGTDITAGNPVKTDEEGYAFIDLPAQPLCKEILFKITALGMQEAVFTKKVECTTEWIDFSPKDLRYSIPFISSEIDTNTVKVYNLLPVDELINGLSISAVDEKIVYLNKQEIESMLGHYLAAPGTNISETGTNIDVNMLLSSTKADANTLVDGNLNITVLLSGNQQKLFAVPFNVFIEWFALEQKVLAKHLNGETITEANPIVFNLSPQTNSQSADFNLVFAVDERAKQFVSTLPVIKSASISGNDEGIINSQVIAEAFNAGGTGYVGKNILIEGLKIGITGSTSAEIVENKKVSLSLDISVLMPDGSTSIVKVPLVFYVSTQELAQVSCESGSFAKPKILLDWKWSAIQFDQAPVVNRATGEISRKATCSNASTYCDSTQFAIELAQRLQKFRENQKESLAFTAYLIADGLSTDFISDFDSYAMSGVFGAQAPSYYTQSNGLHQYFNSNNLEFNAKTHSAGKFEVKIEFSPDAAKSKFVYGTAFSSGEKIIVTLTQKKSVEELEQQNASLFYYLPFDGSVGLIESNGSREGYGLGYRQGEQFAANDLITLTSTNSTTQGVNLSVNSANGLKKLVLNKLTDLAQMNSFENRGSLLKILKETDNTSSLNFSSSIVSPIMIVIEKAAKNWPDGKATVYCALYDAAPTVSQAIDAGEVLAQWNGVGAICTDFEGTYLSKVQFVERKANAEEAPNIVGNNSENIYAIDLTSNSAESKTMHLDALILIPADSTNLKFRVYPYKADIGDSKQFFETIYPVSIGLNGEPETGLSSGEYRAVSLNGVQGFDVSSIEKILKLVEDGNACIVNATDSSGKIVSSTVKWNLKWFEQDYVPFKTLIDEAKLNCTCDLTEARNFRHCYLTDCVDDASDEACCPNATDCVWNGDCYSIGQKYNNNFLCTKNYGWVDLRKCDDSAERCGLCGKEWLNGGEEETFGSFTDLTTQSCCGDDSGENPIGETTKLCCNSSTDVIADGKCTAPVGPEPILLPVKNLMPEAGNAVVTLIWDTSDVNSDYFTKYLVFVSQGDGQHFEQFGDPMTAISTNKKIVSPLTNGTLYYFKVQTVYTVPQVGERIVDSEIKSTTPLEFIPPAPTGLTGTASNTIILTWNAITGIGTLQNYQIFRRASTDSGYPSNALFTISPTSEPTYEDTGVEPGILYYYTLKAIYLEGDKTVYSNFSDEFGPISLPTITLTCEQLCQQILGKNYSGGYCTSNSIEVCSVGTEPLEGGIGVSGGCSNNEQMCCCRVSVSPITVLITSPVNGAAVSGTAVAVSATASSAVGTIVNVKFNTNFTKDICTDNTPSDGFSCAWDTTLWTNGSYTLYANATDSTGNNANGTINVTVSNGGGSVCSPPCPSGYACVEGACKLHTISCENDADCPPNYYCAAATRICIRR